MRKKQQPVLQVDFEVYLTGESKPIVITAKDRAEVVSEIRRQGITQSIERIQE